MKNGTLISAGRANMKPTNSGLIAAPIVRATPVMPAAADRSSGAHDGHDVRLPRRHVHLADAESHQQHETASGSVGISGTRISSTFDGRCVTTIVRTSPNRAASRDASSAEMPGKDVRAEENRAERSGVRRRSADRTSRRRSSGRRSRRRTSPARTAPTASQHDLARSLEPERPANGPGTPSSRRACRLGRRRQAGEHDREDHAEHGVEDDDRAIAADGGAAPCPAALRRSCRRPARRAPSRASPRACTTRNFGPRAIGHDLRQRGLLDRTETARLRCRSG